MEKIARLDVDTLQKGLYRELKFGITSGRFSPGETLTIRSIALAAGTSIMPVREALQRLVAEGAVEARANRTFGIPMLTLASVEELYRIRKVLEGMAAVQACDSCTPALLARLREDAQAVTVAAASGEFEALLAANHRFHFRLYEAAASHHLIGIIESLWMKSGPLLRALSETAAIVAPPRAALADHHADIVCALQQGDRTRLRQAIEDDLNIPIAWYRERYRLVAAEG